MWLRLIFATDICERNSRLTLILILQESFPHLKTSVPVSPVASARTVSLWWALALPPRTHSVNATVATSFLASTACARPAPNVIAARALYASVAYRGTRCARGVARGPFLRSWGAPSPARAAPSAPTARWRSDPACPTLTHCAWVSRKEESAWENTLDF